MIEPRIALVLVGFCQLDINVDISGRGNVTRILSMLWSDVQLESDTGSRGGVYIQLIRDESESPGLEKEWPPEKGGGPEGCTGPGEGETNWWVCHNYSCGDCLKFLYLSPSFIL